MSESTNNGSTKKNTAKAAEPEERPVTTVRLSNVDRLISGASLAVQGATAVFSGLAAFDSHDDSIM